jgi:uncharacterized Fe-S cluster-containing radical SAM superfamily protein
MNKPVLPFLETMVTQACNLACEGCSNYSDLPHKGFVSWRHGKKSISRWLERIDIPDFGILGGEPLMHPRIEDWILGLRELLPTSQIRFTTNGLLLEKKFHVVKLLEEIGNCVFKIAIHVNDPDLEKIIQKIYDSYDWEPVTEFGVERHTTGNRFRFHVKRPDIFWKIYQGKYENMMPHHSVPGEAFEICCQQTCPLLYQDRIYKCSTNGLLRDTLSKAGNPNWEEWQPYLNDGIGVDCPDQALESFLSNFGKPHRVCGMCPSKSYSDSKLIHIDHVSTKKYVIKHRN